MNYDNIYFEGVKPADETFIAMKTVVDNLRKLKIEIPKEIVEYFGVENEYQINTSLSVIILDITNEKYINYKQENNGKDDVYEIGIPSIPKDFTKIRFRLSRNN